MTLALANDRPQVIIILADDMGFDSVSEFNAKIDKSSVQPPTGPNPKANR